MTIEKAGVMVFSFPSRNTCKRSHILLKMLSVKIVELLFEKAVHPNLPNPPGYRPSLEYRGQVFMPPEYIPLMHQACYKTVVAVMGTACQLHLTCSV